MTTTTTLSPAATLALSFWNGAGERSFARVTGVNVVAVARHMALASGRRTTDLAAAKAAMRELLAAGAIEPGDGRALYRPTR